jgi:hypothetical protein
MTGIPDTSINGSFCTVLTKTPVGMTIRYQSNSNIISALVCPRCMSLAEVLPFPLEVSYKIVSNLCPNGDKLQRRHRYYLRPHVALQKSARVYG